MQKVKVCTICNSSVDRYLPLPDFYFEEAAKYGYPIEKSVSETLNKIEYSCPHCGAADRERLYALYIKKLFTSVLPDEKYVFLDIAPAKSLQNFIKVNYNIDYRSMDLFMDDVTYNDSLENTESIKDDEVDFLICSHVLEHVHNDKKALSELHRIMKPGASGIIMVPIDLTMQETDEDINTTEAERWARFGQYDHVRKYAKSDFLQKLDNAGFRVRELGMDFFGMDDYYTNGLTQSSILYIVKK